MADLKVFNELYVFVVMMAYGESLLMMVDESGQNVPMIYRTKESIPQTAYMYVRDVANNHKLYIELKQFKCITKIDQVFPENTLTM